jgi:hypothetical protein
MKDTGQGELVSEGYASLMAIDQRSSANEAIRRWWRAIARFELWFCGFAEGRWAPCPAVIAE